MTVTVPSALEFNDQVLRINVNEEAISKLDARLKKLEDAAIPSPTPTPTILLEDTFPTPYVLAGGATSQDGKWVCKYTGGGKVESVSGAMQMYPATSTASDGKETHACLVISTKQFTDFQLEFTMTTVKQLRQNFPVKNWEVAWVMFRYFDPIHHYYFVLKNQGCEFGKKDNVEGDPALEKQIFMTTLVNKSVVVGTPNKIVVTAKDFHITITVDGVKVVDYTDKPQNPPKMAKGSVGLYCEDALVKFDDIKVIARGS